MSGAAAGEGTETTGALHVKEQKPHLLSILALVYNFLPMYERRGEWGRGEAAVGEREPRGRCCVIALRV